MVVVPRARALDEGHIGRRLAVRGPRDLATGGAVGRGHPLQLHVGDHVVAVGVGQGVELGGVVGVPAGSDDHGADLGLDGLGLVHRASRSGRLHEDLVLVRRLGGLDLDRDVEVTALAAELLHRRRVQQLDPGVVPDPTEVDLQSTGGGAKLGEVVVQPDDPAPKVCLLLDQDDVMADLSRLDRSRDPRYAATDHQDGVVAHRVLPASPPSEGCQEWFHK